MSQLHDAFARVDDKQAFIRFLEAFRADLVRELARPDEEVRWGAGDWSHPDLDGFLETLAAWVADSGRFDDLDSASWKAFAEMLMAARIYE